MNYKHCCVIDAEKRYKTFVLVVDGAVQYYSLNDGETLAETNPPRMRTHAGENGFISPIWDTDAWNETATADEIAAWEAEHPAPPDPKVEPTEEEDTSAMLIDHEYRLTLLELGLSEY